eukprot:385594_1
MTQQVTEIDELKCCKFFSIDSQNKECEWFSLVSNFTQYAMQQESKIKGNVGKKLKVTCLAEQNNNKITCHYLIIYDENSHKHNSCMYLLNLSGNDYLLCGTGNIISKG